MCLLLNWDVLVGQETGTTKEVCFVVITLGYHLGLLASLCGWAGLHPNKARSSLDFRRLWDKWRVVVIQMQIEKCHIWMNYVSV